MDGGGSGHDAGFPADGPFHADGGLPRGLALHEGNQIYVSNGVAAARRGWAAA